MENALLFTLVKFDPEIVYKTEQDASDNSPPRTTLLEFKPPYEKLRPVLLPSLNFAFLFFIFYFPFSCYSPSNNIFKIFAKF